MCPLGPDSGILRCGRKETRRASGCRGPRLTGSRRTVAESGPASGLWRPIGSLSASRDRKRSAGRGARPGPCCRPSPHLTSGRFPCVVDATCLLGPDSGFLRCGRKETRRRARPWARIRCGRESVLGSGGRIWSRERLVASDRVAFGVPGPESVIRPRRSVGPVLPPLAAPHLRTVSLRGGRNVPPGPGFRLPALRTQGNPPARAPVGPHQGCGEDGVEMPSGEGGRRQVSAAYR